MATQRHTKIKKKKMSRYHSEKRYKRKRRGHYSHYKYRGKRVKRANVRIYKSETILGEEFESLVLQIIDAIFPLDKNQEIQKFFNNKPSEDEMRSYMMAHAQESVRIVHRGFKKAQILIINGLLQIQSEIKRAKEQLKETRRQKSDKKELCLAKVNILEYKETILKHLADTIFWHLIEGKLYIARRFYQNAPGSKNLEDTNYKSVMLVADKINEKPDNFVLLTDITSYVQIGDLVGVINGKRKLIEVKEGERNNEILEDINAVNNSDLPICEFFEKYKERPKDVEQIRRILKQEIVANDEINIINTDSGHDPVTDRNIKIYTPKEATPYFYDELLDLEKQLMTRNFWAYTVVDSCLHIGLYKNKWKMLGRPLLETIAKDQNIEHKLIVDARSVMKTMDCPLLFLPFSRQLIIDILLGKVLMFLMLDIDKFMKLFDYYGTTCSWTSRKEATMLNESTKNLYLYLNGNRAIKMKNVHGVESIMTMGVLAKILFNHIRPTYMAYSSNYFTNAIIDE